MNIIEKALEKKARKTSVEPEETIQLETHFKSVAEDLESREEQQLVEKPVARKKVKPVASPLPSKIDVKINFVQMKDKGMLAPDVSQTQLAEEYRIIKRPILANIDGSDSNGIEHANLVLVTSSLPGEGKTFTAVNLALSIATERDKTVMLIDGDVAKPSISKLFGIEAKKGLIDLIEGEATFKEVMLRTDIPNLTVLPAGKIHKQSTEILASAAMKKIATEISNRYPDRIIIIDSPPLLAATQGEVLASLVGQVVLVIESDKTPQHLMKETAARLSSCDVVGCVLNKSRTGFGMGYYYGYGNYAE